MESLVTCKNCKSKVPMEDLRADKTGSGWICLSCYENQHPEIYNKPKEKVQPKKPTSPKEIKYQCQSCGYKFLKDDKFTGKCPYCDRYGSVKPMQDAESILRDTIRETEGFTRHRIEILDD